MEWFRQVRLARPNLREAPRWVLALLALERRWLAQERELVKEWLRALPGRRRGRGGGRVRGQRQETSWAHCIEGQG